MNGVCGSRPTRPGVFRLRCGPRAWLEPGKQTLRAQRQADMLLARQEPVGEMECHALASGGWRLTQGEAGLEVGGADAGLRLSRSDQCVARARLPIRPSGDGDEGRWSLDWTLESDEGLYGLGESCTALDRRGIRLVSDLPADRTLPLVWSPRGWGAHVNTLDRVEHDLRAEKASMQSARGARVLTCSCSSATRPNPESVHGAHRTRRPAQSVAHGGLAGPGAGPVRRIQFAAAQPARPGHGA